LSVKLWAINVAGTSASRSAIARIRELREFMEASLG
jgi:hypothetical protein